MEHSVLKLLRLSLLALAVLTPPAVARAEGPEDRAVMVTRVLLDEAHRALAGGNDLAALRVAIEQAFAFDIWERFLIEDRSAAFTPDQRAEFRAMLPGFMAYLYINQFDRGLSDPPSVGEARKVRRDYLVSSRFKREGRDDLPVEWRLREFPGGSSQVIDMMVGGTSFLMLKREEFHAIIDKSGAEGMLKYMRENSS